MPCWGFLKASRSLHIYYDLLYFSMEFLCVWTCVSLYLCVFLELFFGSFASICLFDSIWFYFIAVLGVCLYSKKREREGIHLGGRGSREILGGIGRAEPYNAWKKLFSIKIKGSRHNVYHKSNREYLFKVTPIQVKIFVY